MPLRVKRVNEQQTEKNQYFPLCDPQSPDRPTIVKPCHTNQCIAEPTATKTDIANVMNIAHMALRGKKKCNFCTVVCPVGEQLVICTQCWMFCNEFVVLQFETVFNVERSIQY